ncbi:transposase C of IS166 homeodomain protein [Rickettsia endosymbiont of Ixodes pacificus]|uniref:IS66 family transposase n=1 Tax=Rickettsia endosymbiont of Ixodes pacificus TaxID=1133329 RepID=UPI0005F78BBF|nr:hypothetical protein [Rickettsia endosymbiont of Ixodes pacificus]KJW02160.1 transposase C of IS166 homeodomain protein [Rickettsia endosymbiont of Ixodes pacificus]
MIFNLNNLSCDVSILHKTIKVLFDENELLNQENQSLREQLALLKAKSYGKSSEKLGKQIEELELKIEENEIILGFKPEQGNFGSDKGQEISDSKDSKQLAKRRKLPNYLPREDEVLNPAEECPSCGGVEFRKISDDISETLEYS